MTQGHVTGLTENPSPPQVLIRVRLHTSRSKGKSAFLVLRQQTATIQAILFVDDKTVSKGMVKYAAGIPRESILDVEARVVCPDMLVEGCTQNEVQCQCRQCNSIICTSMIMCTVLMTMGLSCAST